MSIGNQIMSIRRERQLTQEQFGSLFHVTRQTVSNWENGKSYPDLQLRGRVCQDTFCGFSKLNDLSVKKSPKTSCLQMS